jgi:hypothetical protein
VEAIPLSAEDRAILDLECNTVAGHTCKVIVLDGPAPRIDDLRAHVAARLDDAPPLRWRLGGEPGAPAWVPADDFDIERRIAAADVDGPLDSAGLAREVARLFEQRLDRDRPLWKIDVIPLEGEGAALVWRIHHALADGTAAMRFARAVLWDEVAAASRPRPHEHAADDARRRAHLVRFIEREFGEALRRSPFDGRIGTRREIAFASVALKAIHDAAKSLAGATVNDAVLTIVAGGVRRWLEEHHRRLGAIRVRVPVSLHHEGDDASNRDSFFSLAVPVGEPDPVVRLRAVHEATMARKAEDDAERLDSMFRELAHLSRRLERLAQSVEASPRRFALSVSNVPGPPGPVSVLGAPVESLHMVAEIGRRHALRVSAVSFAGSLDFAFCADPALVDDLSAMTRGLEDDAAALIAAPRDHVAVAYDEDLANRIRGLVGGERDVAEKRMFGGLAFLIAGNMSVAASGQGGLLVRVDPADTDELLTRPHARPFEMRGRSMQGWLRIDAEGVRTRRQLEPWVKRGVDYARSLPPKR